jgi:hypothetical protein
MVQARLLEDSPVPQSADPLHGRLDDIAIVQLTNLLGVPSAMIAPGSSVVKDEMYSMTDGMSKTMSVVLDFCLCSPFTSQLQLKVHRVGELV